MLDTPANIHLSLTGLVEIALQVPHQWPAFARHMSDAMSGNGTALFKVVSVMGRGDMVRGAVTCADNVPYSRYNRTEWPTPEGMTNYALQAIENYSRRWALSSVTSEPDGGCQFWPTNKLEDIKDGTAVERFAGPWNVSGFIASEFQRQR